MSTINEPFAEGLKIIDLTVENDPNCLVFVRHRLWAAVNVDDREAQMTESDLSVEKNTLPVGPTMGDRRQHRIDLRPSYAVV